MNETMILIAVGVIVLIAAVISFTLYYNQRQYRQLTESRLRQLTEQLNIFKRQYDKFIKQNMLLEKELTVFKTTLESMSHSSQKTPVREAKKMVELGATVDDLVSHCDLPYAEAELMVAMHHKHQ